MTRHQETPLEGIANPQDRLAQLIWLLDELDADQENLERLLFGSLADPYPPVRQRAGKEIIDRMTPQRASWLRQLALGESPEDVPAWFPSPTREVQQAAILALRGDHSKDGQDALARLTSHPDADIRYQALVTLFSLDASDERLEPLAMQAYDDRDDEVAMIAAQAASARGWTHHLDAMIKRRESLRGELRLQFTLAIAELLPEGERPELVEGIMEELEMGVANEKTSAACASALVDVARRHNLVARATHTLRKELDRWFLHPLLKVEAAAQLTRLGDSRGLDFLSNSFDSRRKDARGYAIDVAGKFKLGALYGRVARVAQDASDYHCDTAILALSNYNTQEARELLEELATNHADGELRELAAQALEAPAGVIHTFMGMELASEE